MANPIYQATQRGSNPMQGSFIQFMNQHKGKDPNAMINELVNSGRLSQAQLNQAQQQAERIKGDLGGLRSMFGFK